MKKDIHPRYYNNATIACACGNVITVGSTIKQSTVEICAACHPFFTGKKKVMDAAGRVEKFQTRMSKKRDVPKRTPRPKNKVS